MNTQHAVGIGLDIRTTGHHGCALDPDETKLFNKPLPQAQPNTIGTLPIAVA